ncbi:MAG TPA: DinB family protein [Vicinamibacterales bacterium]|nr:DinB family protein [Vicinamibacterales bacterium]
MIETPQQYTQRILGYVDRQDPLAVQAATAKKLDRLIKGVSKARLRKRPAPEKWSVSEIVAHLADAEIVGAFRMRLVLGSPGVEIAAYNQDTWNTSGHYDARDPRKSVEQFRVVREGNLALLKSLSPEQWKHDGLHSERGRESIELMVRMFAGHDVNHLRQIEAILGAASDASRRRRRRPGSPVRRRGRRRAARA